MSKSASQLTKQFRRQTENLFINASPRDPWVQLQRKDDLRGIKNGDLKVQSEEKSVTTLPSTSELSEMLGDCTMSGTDKNMSCSNGDDFLKLYNLCLHNLCSSSNSIEMIRIYASTYPWTLKQRDSNGDIPLHVAIKRDDPSLIVIYELACPETARIRDRNGDLPLFLACRKPKVNVGILRKLIQVYPEAVYVKSYGSTALHHLVHTGCATPENVKLLLSFNSDAVRTPNCFGNLPLHYLCASETPNLHTVRLLLSAYPEGITYRNKTGETPIERALKKNKDEDMRERIRIMLNTSNHFALNTCQSNLLKQLNWEARRLIVLICNNTAKKSFNAKENALYNESKLLMDICNSYDGIY